MFWNYRVIRHDPKPGDPSHIWYGLHEVFYDDNGEPAGCTLNAIAPIWGEEDSGEEVLQMMGQAFGRPIIDFHDFDPGGKYYGNSMFAIDDTEMKVLTGNLEDLDLDAE